MILIKLLISTVGRTENRIGRDESEIADAQSYSFAISQCPATTTRRWRTGCDKCPRSCHIDPDRAAIDSFVEPSDNVVARLVAVGQTKSTAPFQSGNSDDVDRGGIAFGRQQQ